MGESETGQLKRDIEKLWRYAAAIENSVLEQTTEEYRRLFRLVKDLIASISTINDRLDDLEKSVK